MIAGPGDFRVEGDSRVETGGSRVVTGRPS
jgi:hypothetical protein